MSSFRTTAGAGTDRVVVLLSEVGPVDDVVTMLEAAGNGRVAVAEDNDGDGALRLVASARDGEVRTVHRRTCSTPTRRTPAPPSSAARGQVTENVLTAGVAPAAATYRR